MLDARRHEPARPWRGLGSALRHARRQYVGFLIHLGLVSLAIGVTGSSLGTQQQDVELRRGQTVAWAGYEIRLARLRQRDLPDKVIGEAELELWQAGQLVATLWPAQHFHLVQQQRTTEVAIHSSWRGDVYVILHSGDGKETARLTLVENPLMRWLWLSGGIVAVAVVLRLWPARRRREAAAAVSAATAKEPTGSRGLKRRGRESFSGELFGEGKTHGRKRLRPERTQG